MRALQLKPKEWICLLHVQSIRRYHYRTASLKMAFQVRLVSEVRRLEWALLVCTSLECYCPRFDFFLYFFSPLKKGLELPLPNVLGLCFETQMKWGVNADVCAVQRWLNGIVNSFVARRLIFFYACHDFCLKKHNPLFIFPLRLPCWKEIELFKNSLGKQNKKRGGGGKDWGKKITNTFSRS